MPIQIKGLTEIKKGFKDFTFKGRNVQRRFLDLIGEMAIEALRFNVPIDTGTLRDSFTKQISKDTVTIFTSEFDTLAQLVEGSPPHLIEPKSAKVLRFEIGGQEIFTTEVFHPGTVPLPILDNIQRQISRIILDTLKQAMAEKHPFFTSLRGVGGKGRQFQQVGRTSAGFSGGISFAGRSTLVRAGTGRRQLKRRLTLRRRRGSTMKRDNIVKLG